MACQAVAQKAGKRAILAQGLLRRRLRWFDRIMIPKATADAKEEIIHSEMMEAVVDERAWIEGIKCEMVEASDMPEIAPKMVLGAWRRGTTIRV
jgi:hypothetical protein